MRIVFLATEAWRQAYPTAAVGFLWMRGVSNPEEHPGLDRRKEDLEADLRQRFAGLDRAALRALPALAAYAAYYRRFDKTYHVQLQLESIVLKGRAIPRVAALVEAMFMAELNSQLLTAGHDMAFVRPPVRIDVATGSEVYGRLDGTEQVLKAGDMYIADRRGVLSSILYGPDSHSRMRPETQEVLFTVYAPPGIEPAHARAHLAEIRSLVQVVSPAAETVEQSVLTP
jgi:DNA/RNA-binding domain of Phe-tRNA-synthetase-like protein